MAFLKKKKNKEETKEETKIIEANSEIKEPAEQKLTIGDISIGEAHIASTILNVGSAIIDALKENTEMLKKISEQ